MTLRRNFLVLAVSGIVAMGIVTPAFAVEKLAPKAAFAAVRAGNIILVDIRRPDEWNATGVAQGALRMDMRSPDFMQRLEDLRASNPSKKIALICQAGIRSARISDQLEQSGLSGLIDVIGGTQLWIEQGLPLKN